MRDVTPEADRGWSDTIAGFEDGRKRAMSPVTWVALEAGQGEETFSPRASKRNAVLLIH